jgi:hypothetical protein
MIINLEEVVSWLDAGTAYAQEGMECAYLKLA